jgi:hypothetical protein
MTECGTLDFPSLASCGHAGPDRQMGSLVITDILFDAVAFVRRSKNLSRGEAPSD